MDRLRRPSIDAADRRVLAMFAVLSLVFVLVCVLLGLGLGAGVAVYRLVSGG